MSFLKRFSGREYSATEALIIDLLRAYLTAESRVRQQRNVDWTKLNAIASRNGLSGILLSLSHDQEIPIPEPVRKNWKRYAIQAFLNHERAEQATCRLFNIFERESIDAVVLRGMALTQWVYQEVTHRPMTDVDILIRQDQQTGLQQRLEKYGLTPFKKLRSQQVYFLNDIKFEIHWSFLTPKRYRKSADFDQWLLVRRKIEKSGGAIYVLTPETELLDLVLHAFIHHELDTMLKLVDIALLASRSDLDWDYISGWCTEHRLSKPFVLTFALIDALWDLGLTARFTFEGKLPSQYDDILAAYAGRYFECDSVASLMQRKRALLYCSDNWYRKLQQLIRFISKDQLQELYQALLAYSR